MGRRPLLDLNAVQEAARNADFGRPVLGDGLVHLTKDWLTHGHFSAAARRNVRAAFPRTGRKKRLCYSSRVMFPVGFSPPIQPASPPPVFCAECGCEVDPAAWQCATCGRSLHVPDAMTSTRPYPIGPPQKSQPAYNLAGRIFGIAVFVGFWVLYEGTRWSHSPAIHAKHLEWPLRGLFVLLLLILLWADGIFDR
jgi:hypothetical protein